MLEHCLNGLLNMEEFQHMFQGSLVSGYLLCFGTCKLKVNKPFSFFYCLTENMKSVQTKDFL